MADIGSLPSFLSDVADSIRKVSSTNEQLTPSEFDEYITDIPKKINVNIKGAYNNISDLINANPESGIYIINENGHIYEWTKDGTDTIDLGYYLPKNLIAEEAQERKNKDDELQRKLNSIFCDNVEQMKSLDLSDGDTCITLGYYSVNDGGGAIYKIRTKSNEDVEDNGSIHFIGDSLVAELIIENGEINVKQFGAKGDGETDDLQSIQNAINFYNNIVGNKKDTYLISSNLTIENKNISNLNIKCNPFEVVAGNTYKQAFDITGNNEFINVTVNSNFEFIPSINVYASETENTGIASNVKAFRIINGTTNFYNCKANNCWAFDIVNSSNINVYNFEGKSLEMSIFISENSKATFYKSNFEINKEVNSIYYHHIYQIQGCDTKFYECHFTEIGVGNIGNHIHGYSPSFTEDMKVTGKIELNECSLITKTWAGQLNGSNCIINGGKIEAVALFTSGQLVNKPLVKLNNVYINLKSINSTPMCFNNIEINNCEIISNSEGNDTLFNRETTIKNSKIILAGTKGTKKISGGKYSLYNTIIESNNISLTLDISEATADNILNYEIIIDNCFFNVKSFVWCYPCYCSKFKISNTIYNLLEEKTTANPNDRAVEGYIYNCIFNNWAIPIREGETVIKKHYIANNILKSNISN